MKIPIVTGNKKRYFDCYRRWLDQEQPNHHIHVKPRKHHEYVCVAVKRLNGIVHFAASFRIDSHQPLSIALQKARQFRDTIPTEIFLMRSSGDVDLPYINQDKRNGAWRFGATKYQRFTNNFPFPYDSAVKCLFDDLGVEYPDDLFKYTCDQPVRQSA